MGAVDRGHGGGRDPLLEAGDATLNKSGDRRPWTSWGEAMYDLVGGGGRSLT